MPLQCRCNAAAMPLQCVLKPALRASGVTCQLVSYTEKADFGKPHKALSQRLVRAVPQCRYKTTVDLGGG
jgi:hypothetical protein